MGQRAIPYPDEDTAFRCDIILVSGKKTAFCCVCLCSMQYCKMFKMDE